MKTEIMNERDQVLIAANPRAGTGSRRGLIEHLERELRECGLTATVETNADALATRSLDLASEGRLRAVVAAGGDGTFRLVADRVPVGTSLAILPLGTENLLAHYLEMPPDPGRLARVIAAGCTVTLDAGRAGGQLFSLMAGCGFDADVVRRLHEGRTGNIHHLSYAKPILDSIRNYDYPELRIHYAPTGSEEPAEQITARWVFVVNLPRYAGGLQFAPHATGSDGLLDVCTFREGSLWHGLRYLSGVVFGQHEEMQDFVHVQTSKLRIESEARVPYQLDGDPGGELPVEIAIEAGRLTLLVSAEWAEKHYSQQ